MTETEESYLKKKNLHVIRGHIIDVGFKRQQVEESFDYMPRDGDIIIASFPKTGTTWVSYIVHQIVTNCESYPDFTSMLKQVIPFMDRTGVAAVEALTTNPRVYKHHFPYDKVQKNPNSKYIYTYRNPEDTLVSYYHFMKNIYESNEFDQFFEDFLKGHVSGGSYFGHILSYSDHASDENLLLVSFEKLHAQRKEEILRIAQFLAEEYYEKLINDLPMMDTIIERTSFDYMKKNLTPAEDSDAAEDIPKHQIRFFRKGIVGDGKETLQKDQRNRLKVHILEKMKGTEILDEWLSQF